MLCVDAELSLINLQSSAKDGKDDIFIIVLMMQHIQYKMRLNVKPNILHL